MVNSPNILLVHLFLTQTKYLLLECHVQHKLMNCALKMLVHAIVCNLLSAFIQVAISSASSQGTLVLIGGPTPRNITTFAVLYVVGNVIALCATGFLLGEY